MEICQQLLECVHIIAMVGLLLLDFDKVPILATFDK